MSERISNQIPAIRVEGRTLPEVWEKSVLAVWETGTRIRTQYDREGDPLSADATMMMVVHEPMSEPRIHLRFPTGLQDLEIYRQEVVEGIHDHWVGEHGWTYSYHDRLFNYPLGNGRYLNQIAVMIDTLAKTPYSRRAEAITWVPELDATDPEPPCLQRVWCRILEDEQGELSLNMNTHWRSRDAFKAAFMNIFAITDLQRIMAEQIAAKMGRPVGVGGYTDIADSYHIYGSNHQEFNRFLEGLKKRSFEQRTISSLDPVVQEEFTIARQRIDTNNS